MARKKISQLESATDVTASDFIQIVDVEDSDMAVSGTNKKATAQLLANELGKLTNVTATGSTTARSLANRFADTVNVKDFGAVGDGIADDTAAIQAAINSGAKQLVATAGGVYRITNTISINASGRFKLDFNDSSLLLDDASGIKSHIIAGNGITQRYVTIKNVTFARQQAATAGYAIEFNYVGVSEISGCRIYGNNEIYNGISIYRGTIVNIQNNYIDNCINIGIRLEGSDNTVNRTIDVIIRENRIEGGVTALYTWDFVEGVFCRDNIFFNTSSTGVISSASSNTNGLLSFKFEGNDFDTCGGTGLYIDNINNIQVCDCWFSNNGADDLQIKSGVSTCIISSNQFYPSASAIRVEGVGCRIEGNIISGGTTCINLISSANRTGITGNTIKNAQIAVALSTAQNTHFASNLLSNISVVPVSGVGGAGTMVQNNNGDSAVGTNAFISVGASPFTYTTGPRPEYVSIFGGTVSQISLGANSISFTSNQSVSLAPNQSVTVTYSSIPYMVKNVL